MSSAPGPEGPPRRAAWKGRALGEEAQKLVAAEKRSPEEQTRLNRLLLNAAYPELVAAP